MGTLHVIATPIGNLEDITLRALRLLSHADLLFAEDTRRARILLDRHEIPVRPVSLHSHNERSRIDRAIGVLEDDGSVVLISDAGTPLVSDPGERLVAAALEAGHRVEAIPGASAVLAALVVSGLPTASFTFVGFLPRRGSARRSAIASLAVRPETAVLFESPHRVGRTLGELAEALGPRRACVARELTKLHEETVRGTLGELAMRFEGPARGEITIVIEGCDEASIAETGDVALDDDELLHRIRELSEAGRGAKDIAAELAPASRLSKREIYSRVLAAREDS